MDDSGGVNVFDASGDLGYYPVRACLAEPAAVVARVAEVGEEVTARAESGHQQSVFLVFKDIEQADNVRAFFAKAQGVALADAASVGTVLEGFRPDGLDVYRGTRDAVLGLVELARGAAVTAVAAQFVL